MKTCDIESNKDNIKAPGNEDRSVNRFTISLAKNEGVSSLAFLVQLQHCLQEIPLNSVHGPREATLETVTLVIRQAPIQERN